MGRLYHSKLGFDGKPQPRVCVTQRMIDPPVTKCEVCGAPVQRVFHPVAVHFKGSGFYTTDYGSGKAAAAAGDNSSDSGSSEKKADSNSDSPSSSHVVFIIPSAPACCPSRTKFAMFFDAASMFGKIWFQVWAPGQTN